MRRAVVVNNLRRDCHQTIRAIVFCVMLMVLLAVPGAAQPRCAGDCDGDGVVSRAEFDYVLTGVIVAIFDPPLSRDRFECLDPDGDGTVLPSEVLAWFNNADGPCLTPCIGDCSGDGPVSISDLVTGANVVAGAAPPEACEAILCNGLGVPVQINCLIDAINNALQGCP